MNLAPWLPVANACHSVGEIWMIWLKLEFRRSAGSMFFICLNASSRAERTQSHCWMCMNVRHDGQQRRSKKEPAKYMRLSMQTR